MMFCAINLAADENQELKLLGRTIIYEDGSWVKPNEPKFKLTKPKTWFKRNYVRHYMQGTQEVTSSIIHFEWKKFKHAAITGDRVPMKDVVSVLRLKDTYKAIKTHPEAALVPLSMAVGAVAEGGSPQNLKDLYAASEGTTMFTVGVIKNIGEITLKTLKFISKPVAKIIPLRQEEEVRQ